ncbi:YggT family protein [Sediminivirga luteola]|uniref:YggT family protein n=1 Tax=Sediminivirga luteola TaxID=1774748 RepID=A0A8J2TZH7_9MICO|nr:YggT family protein [Sediminivirga luteola]MCI2267075.1 YggT family protein [Sediminivirga luteola]GGA21035.1 YggT family protein [Sediminivirga luteola]
MGLLLLLAVALLNLYFYVLIARVIIDLIQILSRDWRPTGIVLVICEFVFTVTDPPLRFLRRFIPPLRLGRISLDLAFIVLILLINIVSTVLIQVAGSMA